MISVSNGLMSRCYVFVLELARPKVTVFRTSSGAASAICQSGITPGASLMVENASRTAMKVVASRISLSGKPAARSSSTSCAVVAFGFSTAFRAHAGTAINYPQEGGIFTLPGRTAGAYSETASHGAESAPLAWPASAGVKGRSGSFADPGRFQWRSFARISAIGSNARRSPALAAPKAVAAFRGMRSQPESPWRAFR